MLRASLMLGLNRRSPAGLSQLQQSRLANPAKSTRCEVIHVLETVIRHEVTGDVVRGDGGRASAPPSARPGGAHIAGCRRNHRRRHFRDDRARAAEDAGPAIVLSYCVAGLGCALAAFCYAEFAAMVPVAGSAYTYAYATLGELLAWIIGWDLILEYAMGCGTVAASWSGYFNSFLKALKLPEVPYQLCNDPFTSQVLEDGTRVNGIFNLPAVAIMVW